MSFVIPKPNDDTGEGGNLTTKIRIRLKKLTKTRLFSRKIKDGVKIQDYDSDDDEDVDVLLSGKKREDETLPDKLRRLVRYEALFAKYLDAHDSDDETIGTANRQESLEGFIKRTKQGNEQSLSPHYNHIPPLSRPSITSLYYIPSSHPHPTITLFSHMIVIQRIKQGNKQSPLYNHIPLQPHPCITSFYHKTTIITIVLLSFFLLAFFLLSHFSHSSHITERRSLRESKLSAARNLTNKDHVKPTTSQLPSKSHVKVAVGVGATPTTPTDASLSTTALGPLGLSGAMGAIGASELDTGSGVGSGTGVGGGILSSVLQSTNLHPSPPKLKGTGIGIGSGTGYEESLQRVRTKLYRRHKSHRSSDDLEALQKNAHRFVGMIGNLSIPLPRPLLLPLP